MTQTTDFVGRGGAKPASWGEEEQRNVRISGQIGPVDKVLSRPCNYSIIKEKAGEVGRMQLKLHMITIEALMPQDHFLRKLEAALD